MPTIACICAKINQDTAGACSSTNGKYVVRQYNCGSGLPEFPAKFLKQDSGTFVEAGYTLFNAKGDTTTPGTAAYAASQAGITTACTIQFRVRVKGPGTMVTLQLGKKLGGTVYPVDINPDLNSETLQVQASTQGTDNVFVIPAGGCVDFIRLVATPASGTAEIQGKTANYAANCGVETFSGAGAEFDVAAGLCWGYEITII